MFSVRCFAAVMLTSNLVAFTAARADDNPVAQNHYLPYPRVKPVVEGISWPTGQALPNFATPAATLDAVDVRALTIDERITFAALQGLINKQQPRIYLFDSRSGEGADIWASTPPVALTFAHHYDQHDKFDLIAKYASELHGVVVYDTKLSAHYRNLASTVAGLHSALPVTADVLNELKQHGISLNVIVDLSSLTYSTPLEIYQHLYDTYWSQCNKRLLVSLRPDQRQGHHHHIRDLAAACGAAVIWLDGQLPAEKEMLRKYFRDLQAGQSIVLGWYTTERSGITTATEFGISIIPADLYTNSTVHSGADHHIRIPPIPRKPPLHNKIYIALFISDGDNIQFVQRAMRPLWDQAAPVRGRVPLNWTIAPGLVDIGPALLNYYYSTATSADCFVAGPSGMGYLMPANTLEEPGAPVGEFLTDESKMDAFAKLTETYLRRSGLRVLTIWDNANATQRSAYARNCRSLYGATVHNFRDVPSVSASIADERLRFEKFVLPYAGTHEHLHRVMFEEIERCNDQAPHFLTFQASAWAEMKPARLVELAQEVTQRYGDRVEFVRADHYFLLYNEARGLPFNLSLSPTTTVQSSSAENVRDQAVDGSPETMWTAADNAVAWLELAFDRTYQLSRCVIRHAGDQGLAPELNTRDFTLEASADGITWTQLGDVHDNHDNVTDIDLSPILAQRVRLKIQDAGGDRARIAEMEIFGSRPPSITDHATNPDERLKAPR